MQTLLGFCDNELIGKHSSLTWLQMMRIVYWQARFIKKRSQIAKKNNIWRNDGEVLVYKYNIAYVRIFTRTES